MHMVKRAMAQAKLLLPPLPPPPLRIRTQACTACRCTVRLAARCHPTWSMAMVPWWSRQSVPQVTGGNNTGCGDDFAASVRMHSMASRARRSLHAAHRARLSTRIAPSRLHPYIHIAGLSSPMPGEIDAGPCRFTLRKLPLTHCYCCCCCWRVRRPGSAVRAPHARPTRHPATARPSLP